MTGNPIKKILTSHCKLIVAALFIALAVAAPRLTLPGTIPAGQTQWTARADRFWSALQDWRLEDTYQAPHPGLTVMWAGGAAQRISGASNVAQRTVSASFGVALVNCLVILAIIWLVRRLLVADRSALPAAAALGAGLLLAFDPMLIQLTGLIGTDGMLTCFILAAFCVIAVHERSGSKASLAAAVLLTGFAAATKAPGFLLAPLPLLLWLATPGKWRTGWGRRLIGFAALGVGSVLVLLLLLPACWIDPVGAVHKILNEGGEVFVESHKQFFYGKNTDTPGPLYLLVNLLFRITPLALLGSLAGLLSRRYRASRLVRHTAVFFVLFLFGMTLVEKKSWRYIAPTVGLLDILGGLGLWALATDLAERLRRPAIALIAPAVILVQAAWVFGAAPYYLLRFNPMLGGIQAAYEAIPIGYGEGMEQAMWILDKEARRRGEKITWSGGYEGRKEFRKGREFESKRVRWIGRNPKKKADCHVYYVSTLQRRSFRRSDKQWFDRGKELASVKKQGIEMVRVRCEEQAEKSARPKPLAKKPPKKLVYRIKEKVQKGVAAKGINVIWFLIDAQRADHLGCYGYEKDTSPFIDALSEQAALFKNAVAQESYTQASVPSYLTSTYPRVNGVLYDNPRMDVLDPKFVTIAEVLSAEGYVTAAFVFNPHLKLKFGFGQGFDLYDDDPEGWPEDQPVHEQYETARKIHDKAERFLRINEQRPVFLYMHYRDVHDPYAPPPPFHEMFLPTGAAPVIDVLYPNGKSGKKPSMRRNLDLYLSQYDGEIRYTDHFIQKTVAMLAEYGITGENSIFILTADHGEEFYDPHPGDRGGQFHGRTLHRELVHVPLLISLPGLEPKKKLYESHVELVDIVPTILEHLGIDAQRFGQFQGKSLVPMLQSKKEIDRPVYSGGSHQRGMIIMDGWKYYRNDKRNKARRSRNFRQPKEDQQYEMIEELYHIAEDPKETQNLIAQRPKIAAKLKKALDELESRLIKRSEAKSVEMDEQTREQLKALGYL